MGADRVWIAESQHGLIDGFAYWHDPVKSGGVKQPDKGRSVAGHSHVPVSYTHLTLPTKA